MDLPRGCSLLMLLGVGVLGMLGGSRGLVAKCPTAGSSTPSYCSCSTRPPIGIRCDFQNKEDVILTKELLEPYFNQSIISAYVQMSNASSLKVTSGFMQSWMTYVSFAFDLWHISNVTLQSTPRIGNDTKAKIGTFAGVGILNCNITEVPPNFLRDRSRGALRIKQSRVGVMRAGLFNNVEQIRYLVLENSEVGKVEGSVAAEGYLTLSKRRVHKWNGLMLSNVSIDVIGPGAFNLTHKMEVEDMIVNYSYVGEVGRAALAAWGDLSVTINENHFKTLNTGAFQVNVTGRVMFSGNQMGARGMDALRNLACHDDAFVNNNTFFVSTPVTPNTGQASTPFHPSCGRPQLVLVLTHDEEDVVVEVDTRAAWVLGVTVGVLAVAMVAGVAWSYRRQRPIFSLDLFPSLLGRRIHKSSQENLPKNIELNIPRDDLEEGTSVSDLDLTCEPQKDEQQEPQPQQPVLDAVEVLDTGSASFPTTDSNKPDTDIIPDDYFN